jgi:hypothetical protein
MTRSALATRRRGAMRCRTPARPRWCCAWTTWMPPPARPVPTRSAVPDR